MEASTFAQGLGKEAKMPITAGRMQTGGRGMPVMKPAGGMQMPTIGQASMPTAPAPTPNIRSVPAPERGYTPQATTTMGHEQNLGSTKQAEDKTALLSWGGGQYHLGPNAKKWGLGAEVGYSNIGGIIPIPHVGVRVGTPYGGLGVGGPLPYIGLDNGNVANNRWQRNLPRGVWEYLYDRANDQDVYDVPGVGSAILPDDVGRRLTETPAKSKPKPAAKPAPEAEEKPAEKPAEKQAADPSAFTGNLGGIFQGPAGRGLTTGAALGNTLANGPTANHGASIGRVGPSGPGNYAGMYHGPSPSQHYRGVPDPTDSALETAMSIRGVPPQSGRLPLDNPRNIGLLLSDPDAYHSAVQLDDMESRLTNRRRLHGGQEPYGDSPTMPGGGTFADGALPPAGTASMPPGAPLKTPRPQLPPTTAPGAAMPKLEIPPPGQLPAGPGPKMPTVADLPVDVARPGMMGRSHFALPLHEQFAQEMGAKMKPMPNVPLQRPQVNAKLPGGGIPMAPTPSPTPTAGLVKTNGDLSGMLMQGLPVILATGGLAGYLAYQQRQKQQQQPVEPVAENDSPGDFAADVAKTANAAVTVHQGPTMASRRQLSANETADLAKNQENWFPTILRSQATPLAELTSSPGRGAVLGGLGGAALGGVVGANLSQHTPAEGYGGLIGAGIGALGGGLAEYIRRTIGNADVEETMRRLPEGATRRDMVIDPYQQVMRDEMHDRNIERLAAGAFASKVATSLNPMFNDEHETRPAYRLKRSQIKPYAQYGNEALDEVATRYRKKK